MWSKSNKCRGFGDPGRLLVCSNGCSVELAADRVQLVTVLLLQASEYDFFHLCSSLSTRHHIRLSLTSFENALKVFCELVYSAFGLIFNFIQNYLILCAAYIHHWGKKRQIPANNIWFLSRDCVKIASSQLWQGYATSREHTAWLKYGNISLK